MCKDDVPQFLFLVYRVGRGGCFVRAAFVPDDGQDVLVLGFRHLPFRFEPTGGRRRKWLHDPPLNRNGFHLGRTRVACERNGQDFRKSVVFLEVLPTCLHSCPDGSIDVPVELLYCLGLPPDVLPNQVQVLVQSFLDPLEVLIQGHLKGHLESAASDNTNRKYRAEGVWPQPPQDGIAGERHCDCDPDAGNEAWPITPCEAIRPTSNVNLDFGLIPCHPVLVDCQRRDHHLTRNVLDQIIHRCGQELITRNGVHLLTYALIVVVERGRKIAFVKQVLSLASHVTPHLPERISQWRGNRVH